MSRSILAAAVCAAGIAMAFILVGCDPKALDVNDVAADPTAYKTQITITGIMAAVSPQEPSIFGIMDIKELQCKSQNCNKIIIPVRFRGTLPVRGDEVRLTGAFINQGGGYLFDAQKLKVVRNHKIGG